MGSQETWGHINMVKLQINIPEKQDQAPILKSKRIPQVLPISMRNVRRAEETKKLEDVLTILSNVLLFIGFLMILFSIKSVWNLKMENWRLCKENAVLKKTVKDNIAVETFKAQIQSEEDIKEFEKAEMQGAPDLSWGVSIQIFWSSPYFTPCDMNWLVKEVSDQIYIKQNEHLESLEVQEDKTENILNREERFDDLNDDLEKIDLDDLKDDWEKIEKITTQKPLDLSQDEIEVDLDIQF